MRRLGVREGRARGGRVVRKGDVRARGEAGGWSRSARQWERRGVALTRGGDTRREGEVASRNGESVNLGARERGRAQEFWRGVCAARRWTSYRLSQVQYVFLELPKYAAGDAPATLVDKWAFFFREAKNLDVVPPSLADTPFREALEVSRTAGFTSDEWEAYERAKMAEQDARGALAIERQEGRAEGETEGKRGTLLRLIERKGIVLSDQDRATIAACADPRTLDRWCENVLDASGIRDVFT